MDINSRMFEAAIRQEIFALTFWSAVWFGLMVALAWWVLASAIRWGVSRALKETTVRTKAEGAREMAPLGYRWVLVREETARKLDQIHDMRAD